MAYRYEDLMLAKGERIQAEKAAALADLEASRLREDAEGCDYAQSQILRLDSDYEKLCGYANRYMAQNQQRQPTNRFHLSETEREVAEASLPDRPDMPKLTADQKHEIYYRNRDRLNRMKASGEYSTTQGMAKGSY
jgi:hypothetical protein